jgi:hypothetical protein
VTPEAKSKADDLLVITEARDQIRAEVDEVLDRWRGGGH